MLGVNLWWCAFPSAHIALQDVLVNGRLPADDICPRTCAFSSVQFRMPVPMSVCRFAFALVLALSHPLCTAQKEAQWYSLACDSSIASILGGSNVCVQLGVEFLFRWCNGIMSLDPY